MLFVGFTFLVLSGMGFLVLSGIGLQSKGKGYR